jgi:aspartyl-tRNA(Asn)/glutamyl-tRNA(Gln) amidotransferase subunit A
MNDATNIPFLSAHQLLAGYRDGSLSPVTVVDTILDRIDRHAERINAYVLVDGDRARAQANESASRWKTGSQQGMLEGVPVAIKDVLPVAGWPTRHGSPACADAPAEKEDATAVARLREHGAVFLGKTRTWEFAWHGRVDRPAEEVVPNPWNPLYSTAGSSSGSAAAVATGLCAFALGTDSGGSVRGPASYCGITGIKPTHARVPVYPPSPMMDMEHIGVLARNVTDAALMLSAVGGYHHSDPNSWPFPITDLRTDLDNGIERLTIGVSPDLGFANPHADVCAVFDDVVARLGSLGAVVRELPIKLDESYDTTTTLYTPMAMASLDLVPQENEAMTDPLVRELSQLSNTLSSKEYFRAQQKRLEVCRLFTEAFETFDLILTPTMEALPNRLDEPSPDMLLNRIFDMTGQPSISVPVGFSTQALPIGVQLVAAKGEDALVLRAAKSLETLFPPVTPPFKRT